jgi:DHA2 family multidrug resistance protein
VFFRCSTFTQLPDALCGGRIANSDPAAGGGMALFHLTRAIGSSLFISVCVAKIVRAQGANYSRRTEQITLYNKVSSLPWAMGAWTTVTQAGLALLSREMHRQAAMIGYVSAFGFYTAASAGAILLISMAKKRQRKLAA